MKGAITRLGAALVLLCACISTSFADDREEVKVMSFNIRTMNASRDTGCYNWESRKEACIKAVEKQNPDIIGFQETATTQKEYLIKELSGYVMVDGHSKPGTMETVDSYNSIPIFFKAKEYELLDYGYFRLSDNQLSDKPAWDAAEVRNVTWVKLRYSKSDNVLFYFNTHFDHRGAQARTESANLVCKKINEIAGDEAVVILGGDFNMAPDDPSMTPLKDYMTEASSTVKKTEGFVTYTGYGRKGINQQWLDHLFCRNAEPKSFSIINGKNFGIEYISDHYPVCANFLVKYSNKPGKEAKPEKAPKPDKPAKAGKAR